MLTFRVLLVDDTESFRKSAERSLRKLAGCEVVTCADYVTASAVLEDEFFNVIIIDLFLLTRTSEREARSKLGFALLREAYDTRPSATRILLTSQMQQAYVDVCGCLAPGEDGLIDAVLLKDDWRHFVADEVHKMTQSWFAHTVEVRNAIAIITPYIEERAGERKRERETEPKGRRRVLPSINEIDYLVSRVFGQGRISECKVTGASDATKDWQSGSGPIRQGRDVPCPAVSVELTELRGGMSGALVCGARSTSAQAGLGRWCVLKIAERADAEEEYARYLKFVRFYFQWTHRVDVIDYQEADAFGVLCYPFVGAGPQEELLTLQILLNKHDERAVHWIHVLFGEGMLFGENVDGMSLNEYRSLNFAWKNSAQIGTRLRAIEERFREHIQQENRELWISIAGERFPLPSEAIMSEVFRVSFPARVLHGDFHGGNVIVTASGAGIVIDYRFVGIGPRFIDHAAMEISARLDDCVGRAVEGLGEVLRMEMEVWDASWGELRESGATAATAKFEFWQHISIEIQRNARQRFPDCAAIEYAAAAFFWCMRVFENRQFSEATRTRIFGWMCVLAKKFAAAR